MCIRDSKYPDFVPLYQAIYQRGDRSYWAALDEEVRRFAAEEGLLYVRNDDSIKRPLEAPPIVVNYFFHEEIIPSAKKKKTNVSVIKELDA